MELYVGGDLQTLLEAPVVFFLYSEELTFGLFSDKKWVS